MGKKRGRIKKVEDYKKNCAVENGNIVTPENPPSDSCGKDSMGRFERVLERKMEKKEKLI